MISVQYGAFKYKYILDINTDANIYRERERCGERIICLGELQY